MTSSSARSAAARQRAEQIALFRYQLIREAADDSVSPRQRGPMVRALAAAEHPGPFGGAVRVSRESLDRWIRAWRTGGFDALKPTGRTQGSSTPEAVLSLATGQFRSQYQQSTEGLATVAKRAKSVQTGEVVWSGVVASDEDSATVIVASSGTVSNKTTEFKAVPRNYRLQLDLAYEDERWLTRDLQFVP